MTKLSQAVANDPWGGVAAIQEPSFVFVFPCSISLRLFRRLAWDRVLFLFLVRILLLLLTLLAWAILFLEHGLSVFIGVVQSLQAGDSCLVDGYDSKRRSRYPASYVTGLSERSRSMSFLSWKSGFSPSRVFMLLPLSSSCPRSVNSPIRLSAPSLILAGGGCTYWRRGLGWWGRGWGGCRRFLVGFRRGWGSKGSRLWRAASWCRWRCWGCACPRGWALWPPRWALLPWSFPWFLWEAWQSSNRNRYQIYLTTMPLF